MTLLVEEVRQLEARIGQLERELAEMARQSPACKTLLSIPGVGLITATALVAATAGDVTHFSSARHFGSWIGLTPRQHSSGGKTKLGRITKRGDTYLRTLLIQAAKSAVLSAHKRSDKISSWLCQLRERSGWQVAAVALANKNARILWALMTKGEAFDPNHLSVKPGAAMQPA